jgi:hypothetical protein
MTLSAAVKQAWREEFERFRLTDSFSWAEFEFWVMQLNGDID